MENRIKELDGLRGIAVVLVMALHLFKRSGYFTVHPTLEGFITFTTVGWVGVDIFFTLSGFLITSILLKSKTDEHYFRNFYVRRVLRIFPLYYAAIAFVLLFAPKLEEDFVAQLNTALPIMLLYQQNWALLFKDFHITQYLGITWSLAIEEQFYFLWPFIVYKLNRDNLVRLCIGYIILSIVGRVFGTLLWPVLQQASTFFYYASFARFEEMLFGGLLAIFLTYEGSQEKVHRYAPFVFWGSFVVFIGLHLISLPGSPHPEHGSLPLTLAGYTTAALATIGLIGIFVTYPPGNFLRRLFSNPVLIFLGKYSYSMYLFHMTAALILLDVFWHSEMRGWKPFFIYPLTTYIATVIIALLTWHLLEKHILGLKKYFEYKPQQES
ncbi:MAG TPA: acyltransferase [Anaerolineales bacterium]|nr:acyltransferase [Anaerolineales bacterium]HNC09237.1 acyltransferase [Anaerolineales bacterium]